MSMLGREPLSTARRAASWPGPGLAVGKIISFANDPAKQGRAAQPIAARIASDLLEGDEAAARENQQTAPALNVFIAHQDLFTGLRAKEAFDHIGLKLKLRCVFHLKLWRIQLLEDFDLRMEAAGSAADADVIFLSLHGDRSVPPCLRAWFAQWALEREERPCVVVASFDERHRYSTATRRILGDLHPVAAQHGLEVIPHFDFTAPETASSLSSGAF